MSWRSLPDTKDKIFLPLFIYLPFTMFCLLECLYSNSFLTSDK